MKELVHKDSNFGSKKTLKIDEFNTLIVERFYKDDNEITFQFWNDINQSHSEFYMDFDKLISLSNFIDGIIEEAYSEVL
jgi:hypothetical protein